MKSVYLLFLGVIGLFVFAYWQDFAYQRKFKRMTQRKKEPEDKVP